MIKAFNEKSANSIIVVGFCVNLWPILFEKTFDARMIGANVYAKYAAHHAQRMLNYVTKCVGGGRQREEKKKKRKTHYCKSIGMVCNECQMENGVTQLSK